MGVSGFGPCQSLKLNHSSLYLALTHYQHFQLAKHSLGAQLFDAHAVKQRLLSHGHPDLYDNWQTNPNSTMPTTVEIADNFVPQGHADEEGVSRYWESLLSAKLSQYQC